MKVDSTRVGGDRAQGLLPSLRHHAQAGLGVCIWAWGVREGVKVEKTWVSGDRAHDLRWCIWGEGLVVEVAG